MQACIRPYSPLCTRVRCFHAVAVAARGTTAVVHYLAMPVKSVCSMRHDTAGFGLPAAPPEAVCGGRAHVSQLPQAPYTPSLVCSCPSALVKIV